MLENRAYGGEKISNPESRFAALAKVLAKNYISVVEVDLRTGNAVVLKSSEDLEFEGRELRWCELLERYTQRKTYPEDRAAVLSLTQDFLSAFLEQGREKLTLEVRCVSELEAYIWAAVEVSVISAEKKRLLVTTRNINDERMMKSIVDQFVYQDLDYFVLLNAKNNSYTMFSGTKSGVPLPPEHDDDYAARVREYNLRYVVPEEREWTTANMQIPHIIEMLEKEAQYSFSSTCISEDGDYRRTRVQFMYYDKPAGLILLTRTDITQIFLEEQEKNQRLAAALRDAQHDALTEIFNQRGIESLVLDSLERQDGARAACLFIDVDNFKMVNDTLGHSEGDRLLRFLAKSIREIAGHTGIAGRIGGDEFLLFLPNVPSDEHIKRCAEQVCRVFDTLLKESDMELPVSCSVGISTYPKDGTDYETLLRKADQALYTSKRYGKNKYYFYSEELPTPKSYPADK